MIDESFLKKAVDLGIASTGVKDFSVARPYIVVPGDSKIQEIPDYSLAEPWRLRQDVSVFDPKSFSDYFTDYCNHDSRIFVDLQKPAILGVIDYHGAGTEPTANWTQHRLNYVFRHTAEWKTWTAADRKTMKQVEFARFIEDNLPDIVHPAHADMLQISRTMEAKKNVNFSSGVRLSNGEIQLIYQEEIRGTAAQGTLEIPEIFKIRIAPYEGSDLYTIDCRLRYSIQENSLGIRYEMVRPHKVLDDAVVRVVDAIRQRVTNPITFGAIS